jgi:hypothetical protein
LRAISGEVLVPFIDAAIREATADLATSLVNFGTLLSMVMESFENAIGRSFS